MLSASWVGVALMNAFRFRKYYEIAFSFRNVVEVEQCTMVCPTVSSRKPSAAF